MIDGSYRPVASVVFHSPDALVFIDPLVPDSLWPAIDAEVKTSAAPVVVVTTIKFHARSRDEIVRRYSAKFGGGRGSRRRCSSSRFASRVRCGSGAVTLTRAL